MSYRELYELEAELADLYATAKELVTELRFLDDEYSAVTGQLDTINEAIQKLEKEQPCITGRAHGPSNIDDGTAP